MSLSNEDIFVFVCAFFMLLYAVLLPFALFASKKVELYFYSEGIGHMVALKNGGLPYLNLRFGLYGGVFILHYFNSAKYEFYFSNKRVSRVPLFYKWILSSTFLVGAIALLLSVAAYIIFDN